MEMKIEFDKEADVAYIYLSEIAENGVNETISLNEEINIDLDVDGKVVGIEVLEASKNLTANSLKSINNI